MRGYITHKTPPTLPVLAAATVATVSTVATVDSYLVATGDSYLIATVDSYGFQNGHIHSTLTTTDPTFIAKSHPPLTRR